MPVKRSHLDSPRVRARHLKLRRCSGHPFFMNGQTSTENNPHTDHPAIIWRTPQELAQERLNHEIGEMVAGSKAGVSPNAEHATGGGAARRLS
jgi:hypothetical protein